MKTKDTIRFIETISRELLLQREAILSEPESRKPYLLSIHTEPLLFNARMIEEVVLMIKHLDIKDTLDNGYFAQIIKKDKEIAKDHEYDLLHPIEVYKRNMKIEYVIQGYEGEIGSEIINIKVFQLKDNEVEQTKENFAGVFQFTKASLIMEKAKIQNSEFFDEHLIKHLDWDMNKMKAFC